MPELATHEVGVSEERASRKSVGRRGHFFTDLGAHIWGEAYVGTVGTFGWSTTSEVVPSPWRGIVTDSTAIICDAVDVDAYPDLAPSLIAEFAIKLWGGNVILALPANNQPREADLVYWADSGGAQALCLIEAKFTSTDAVGHAPAWRRTFEAYLAHQQSAEKVWQEGPRDVHAELRSLSDSTRLPVEQLGELVGASRRTIYNWFAGRPIGEDAQARILRLSDVLAPIVESRDPSLVRNWLLRGEPSPASLAVSEHWNELQRLVASEVALLQPSEENFRSAEEVAYADSPEVLRAALAAFASPPSRAQSTRVWQPRELTGIEPEDPADEEAEDAD